MNILKRLEAIWQEMVEIPKILREINLDLDTILTYSRSAAEKKPLPRRAQIMILWTIEGKVDKYLNGPCCWTYGFDIEEQTKHVTTQTIDHEIPEGAWLVAVDCYISQVCIGNSLQDLGSGISGLPLRLIRLRDGIKPGYSLHFNVIR